METIAWSRRALLGAGLAAGLAGCGAAEGRGAAESVVGGSFRSDRMAGRRIGWSIGYPTGHRPGERLPVVVSLHGRGASHRTTFRTLRLGSVLDRIVAAGATPFALASVDGGDHGYWHARADGTDAGAMVVRELIPLLAERGLDTTRLGLYGWSMGGYGALLLASEHVLPVRAVAVSSPALFASAGVTAAGAFDGPADFEEHDVAAHPERLAGIPLRIDCGEDDPFAATTRAFRESLDPEPAGGIGPGGHDTAYWRSQAPAQLRFLAERL